MNLYLDEVLQQPEIFRQIGTKYRTGTLFFELAARLNHHFFKRVIFSGMGSSLYAAYPAYLYLLEQGFSANLCDTSELLHYYPSALRPEDLVVLVSQSGESFEIKALLAGLQAAGRPLILGATANPESYLGQHADLVLDIGCGKEKAIASSKSYTATAITLYLLARKLTKIKGFGSAVPGDAAADNAAADAETALAESAASYLNSWEEEVDRLVDFVDPISHPGQTYFLIGRGPALSSANQGALTLRETTRLNAASLSGGQFRHGPREMLGPEFLAMILAPSGKTSELGYKLAQEVCQYGGRVVLLTNGAESDLRQTLVVKVPSCPDEFLMAAACELPIQLLAYGVSLARGLVPGASQIISKITSEE